jgi:hypothetical protein
MRRLQTRVLVVRSTDEFSIARQDGGDAIVPVMFASWSSVSRRFEYV